MNTRPGVGEQSDCAGQKGEVFVARIRLRVVIALQSIPILSLTDSPHRSENWIGLVVAISALASAVACSRIAAQRDPPRFFAFVTTALDVCLVTLASIGFAVAGRPIIATNNFVHFPFYMVVIFATALRYESRITVFATLLCVLQHLGIALVFARPLVGVVDPQYGFFSWETQIARAVLLGLCGALTASLVRRNAILWTEANQDNLTGLRSRRFFESYARQRLLELDRANESAAVVLLDIDHFKRINDRFGHARGDAVLTAVGRALGEHFRNYDVAARFGGEEFIVLLPRIDPAAATRRVQAFLDKLQRHSLAGLRVTVSAGISIFPADGSSLPALCNVADSRLYVAKNAGRNRLDAGPGSWIADSSAYAAS